MSISIENELKIVGWDPFFGKTAKQPVYNTPISPRENFFRYLRHDSPLWLPGGGDVLNILPMFIPDHAARGMVNDTAPFEPKKQAGGKDMFGVCWVYEAEAGGSMESPDNPMMESAEEWHGFVRMPDYAKYDWEEASERLRPYYSTGRVNKTTVYTGLFERLISYMGFAGAAVALIDEEQQPFVHEMFAALCDSYTEYFHYLRKYLNIDLIYFHDDWGTQRAPFFSLSLCREMLAPYLRRLVDAAHAEGMYFNFHSCGKNEMLVPAMIDAGVDMWTGQNINDWDKLADQFGDRIIFDATWERFADSGAPSKEAYLSKALETWKGHLKHPNIWLTVGKTYNPDIVGKFFEMTYPISRTMLAEG